MALQNLTAAQETAINEAMVLFPDPLMRQALLKAIDAVAGGATVASVTAVEADVAALNAWAAALATKLNADAGVTDIDYDTDPQA